MPYCAMAAAGPREGFEAEEIVPVDFLMPGAPAIYDDDSVTATAAGNIGIAVPCMAHHPPTFPHSRSLRMPVGLTKRVLLHVL